MLKKTLTAAAVAAALLVGAGSASATPLPITLTNLDGSFTPFDGIDWASQGTVVIDGFLPVTGKVFALEYFGTAVTLQFEGGGNIPLPGLNTNYEYTLHGKLTEVASCPTPATCSFTTLGGTFAIYYDILPAGGGAGIKGSYKTGAGITDGAVLMSGHVPAQPGGAFFANLLLGTGSGFAQIDAVVDVTNPLFLDPDLASAGSINTLAIHPTGGFPNTSGWKRADITGRPGAAGASLALTGAELIVQGDSSSSFTSVPEPASLALFGLGLAGLAAARRRKAA